jgi:hypothetical protein
MPGASTTGSSATTTSWLVAATINAAVLGYVSYKAYRNFVVQADKHQQLKRSAQRLWKLATQVGEGTTALPQPWFFLWGVPAVRPGHQADTTGRHSGASTLPSH